MKLFGKTIGTTVIIALLMATSMAATVLYLSNEASTSIDVKAPIEVMMSANGTTDWSEELILTPKYGGEMSEFYIRYENLANESINTNINTFISCSVGITRADFNNSGSEVNGLYYELYNNTNVVIADGYFNEEAYVIETDTTTLTICDDLFFTEVEPLTTYMVKIEMYHAPNAYGTYETSTQVMD